MSSSRERVIDAMPVLRDEAKWAPLVPYFESLDMSDLALLSRDSILMAAEPRHRLLMECFVAKHLEGAIGRPDPYAREQAASAAFDAMSLEDSHGTRASDVVPTLRVSSDGRLDLSRGRVLSERFHGSEWCIRSYLDRMVTPKWLDGPKVTSLLLSQNRLEDNDGYLVLEMVRRYLPNCTLVDLRQNLLDGAGTSNPLEGALVDLLALSVEFVDVSFNCLASYERREFWQARSVPELRKLIWIPERWVHSKEAGWRTMIADGYEHRQAVIDAHDRYYRASSQRAVVRGIGERDGCC